jgi:catechol 2,3-dioxygenase-like lactoylglutathione lyase family enzyme
MKVEGLEPFSPETNDFLVRFLAAAGPGPHHLTFKVPDIEEAIDRARSAGHQPLGVDLSGAHWREAFLHPREAAGIVVQLAWSSGELDSPVPAWLPAGRVPEPAELVHVAHAVADLQGALDLFKGLLDGATVDAGAGGGLGWVDVAWPGPGRLRLLSGDPVSGWLGGRPGRLHHLAFRVTDPGGAACAEARDGWWEVPPGPPLGTRLVLVEPGAPVPLGL